jgi:hypothetical protein
MNYIKITNNNNNIRKNQKKKIISSFNNNNNNNSKDEMNIEKYEEKEKYEDKTSVSGIIRSTYRNQIFKYLKVSLSSLSSPTTTCDFQLFDMLKHEKEGWLLVVHIDNAHQTYVGIDAVGKQHRDAPFPTNPLRIKLYRSAYLSQQQQQQQYQRTPEQTQQFFDTLSTHAVVGSYLTFFDPLEPGCKVYEKCYVRSKQIDELSGCCCWIVYDPVIGFRKVTANLVLALHFNGPSITSREMVNVLEKMKKDEGFGYRDYAHGCLWKAILQAQF